jgi:hypothetical protein
MHRRKPRSLRRTGESFAKKWIEKTPCLILESAPKRRRREINDFCRTHEDYIDDGERSQLAPKLRRSAPNWVDDRLATTLRLLAQVVI